MKPMIHPVAVLLARLQLFNAWRHFFIFIICLALGVSVITTVNLFSNLTRTTLTNESKSLLGGDLEVVLRGVTSLDELKDELDQYGEISKITTTQAMMRTMEDKRSLVSIKAIDDTYPLYGSFKLKNDISPSQLNETRIAVDSALLAQLQLKLGDMIQIGDGSFEIIAEVELEPDRVIQTLNFGPQIIMTHLAFEKTNLMGSIALMRERFRIKLFENTNLAEFTEKLQTDLDEKFPAFNLDVRDQSRQENRVGEFINRLTGFLNLLGLGIFLIAGIGIASSVRAYLSKTYQSVAILKVQGANQTIILQTYSIIIGVLSIFSATIGIILAFILFYILTPFVVKIMPVLKGQIIIDYTVVLIALWYSLLTAYLFSIPSLISLHKMKAANFFRQKVYTFNTPLDKQSLLWISLLSLILVASIILFSSSKIFMLTSIMLMILSLLIFVALAYLARIMARQLNPKSLWLKMALRNISENKSNIYIIILAIGMSLSVLLTLNLTEANFNKQISLRSQTQIPDLFMIDIQPFQKEKLEKMLIENEVNKFAILPLVRGKISHIQGIPVEKLTIPEEIDWALRRDRGISYSNTPPNNARIVQGQWWDEDYQGEALASVDQRLLVEMNLKIGDEITIEILGQSIVAKIASSRAVDYASFQINFFLMLSPNAIKKFPHGYIATVNINEARSAMSDIQKRASLVRNINDQFQNISIVQTEEVINLIQRTITNIGIGLKIMASLSIIAGFLILSSVLSANIQDRYYETAIFKALGANWGHIIKVHLSEWFILCTITCIVAILIGISGAYLINFYFSNDFSEIGFFIVPRVIFNLSAMTYLVVLGIGYLGLRKIFSIKVSSLLRND